MKKFYGFLKERSISSKFAAAYFIILIMQIVLTGVYLYFQASTSAINQAKLVMEQNLMQTRASILEKEKIIENIAPIITYNEDIQDFLEYNYKNLAHQIEDYQFKFSPIMKNILLPVDTVHSIRMYMPDIIVTEKINSFISVTSTGSYELYKAMINKKPKTYGWSNPHDSYDINPTTTAQVFSFSKPVISRHTYHSVGLVELEVKEETLFETLRNSVISEVGRVFIVNDKNIIVSNNIPELYKKNISKIGVYNYTSGKKVNNIESVNNVSSIVISIPIEQIGCNVVGVFPVSNFNGKAKESVINIIIGLLILASLLGIIIYLTTKVLLSRIRKLAKAMKQVREGNLGVSVVVNSRDEFGQLGLSFNHMIGRINDLIETVYKIQIMEREAELKALESQINPHFLYNTLATISWAARKDNSFDAVQITNSLAKFYRLVLSKGRKLISVKEEIDIVVSYLYIQKIRYEDSLDVIYDVDESIYNYKMVKNILQPIVENALIHGIEAKRGHSTIIIKAGLDKQMDRLYFKIIDDGLGMSKRTIEEVLGGNAEGISGSGYALKNIMERLKIYYDKEQSFEIFSRPGFGTVITITIDKNIEDPS
jgi:two-component system, sensor histidine kinase YesM